MRVALVVVFTAAACMGPQATVCPNGTICPERLRCTGLDAPACASSEQLDACRDTADGETCTVRGSVGICDRGVCVFSGCGNGALDSGELCDDGNQASGDGCRADCGKIERCGDAIRDDGESCDDGNANAADGCDACTSTQWRATTVVGGGKLATELGLFQPSGVAVDRDGNLYIAIPNENVVVRADRTGVVTRLAGTGIRGRGGDGGPAANAQLDGPSAVAVDGLGNVFIVDRQNDRIRRVDGATGVIATVAGTVRGFAGDGGLATDAQLSQPTGIAVDGLGVLYIGDAANLRIRRVGTDGIVTTIAGDGFPGSSGDGGPAIFARLGATLGVAIDGDLLYIADTTNHRVRRVDLATGIIDAVAGTGVGSYGGDGGPATAAQLNLPEGVALDASGAIYITESSNRRIRRIDLAGTITTLGGTGVRGFSGDGGPATAAMLGAPQGIAIAGNSTLYFADRNNYRIRAIDLATGIIDTVAGTGEPGYSNDGGLATAARVLMPIELATRGDHLFIAEMLNHRIRRVDLATGLVTTVAGTGVSSISGDGGLATEVDLQLPSAVAVDTASGALYISEHVNHRIRRVDPVTGIITTYAGTLGTQGATGDGGPATSATLRSPRGLAVDAAGHLYIADSSNNQIRRVDAATRVISTIAGAGTPGFSGDGGSAVSAELDRPIAVATHQGALYVADHDNHRVRRVDLTTGIITTLAGNGGAVSGGDGGSPTSAATPSPTGIAVDAGGSAYVSEASGRVRRIAAGVITTVAGNGTAGITGDGGPATDAELGPGGGVAIDAAGALYVADPGNDRVRRVVAGTITAVAGEIDPRDMGPLPLARLADPHALVVGQGLTFVAGGTSDTVQAFASDGVRVVAGRYPHARATGVLARYRDQAFGTIGGIALDSAAGVLYVTESTAHQVHAITIADPADAATWTIAPLATSPGGPGFSDGALATARFREPTGLYFDAAARELYVADTGNHVIRVIVLDTATVRTIAGIPATIGFFGDGGPASLAGLHGPQAIHRCASGDLFVADTQNHRVRRIDPQTNAISTVLGIGVAASDGDGQPASSFSVDSPRGVACDRFGNLVVSSRTAVRLVTADGSGVVDGTGEVQTLYGAYPRDTFPASVTRCLAGLVITGDTTVQIADSCTGLLVELRRVPR